MEKKVEKSAVFTDKHSKNWIYKKFTFPMLKEGSIIEYSYELRLQDEMQGMELLKSLRQITHIDNIRLNFNDTYVNQYD